MNHAIVQVPRPTNEPVRAYAPGSPERASLQARLQTMRAEQVEIPAIIGGREVRTGQLAEIHAPHETSRRLGSFHQCGAVEAKAAVEAALAARESWA